MSLDEIIKALADNTQKFQQETRASIQSLGNQITQIATSVGKLETQNSGKLLSQTVVNPKENASAMVLRSRKEIESKRISPTKDTGEKDNDEEVLETFRKVEINIHLIDVIKQIPSYAKFLKDLCANKKKLNLLCFEFGSLKQVEW